MHFGFSYVGLLFLLMLFVPNLFWTKHKPKNYDEYASNENKILLAFERAGEASVSCLVLIFKEFNIRPAFPWILWLVGAFALMLLYELFWIRYFRSEKNMTDFYRSILGIPVAGASLPVVAVLLLSVYGGNPFLLAAGTVLGVGHIGIHMQHKKEIQNQKQETEGL